MVNGCFPLHAGQLIKLRQAGAVPDFPCVVSIDVHPQPGEFIHLAVPDGFRPYKLNWSPVAGLDVVIFFGITTTYPALFELYQCISAVGARSIVAKLKGEELYFFLKASDA